MLSAELRHLAQQLAEWKNPVGAIWLPAQTVSALESVLKECISIARNIEQSRIQRHPTLIDVSDPKIALFPKVGLPLPATRALDNGDDDSAA